VQLTKRAARAAGVYLVLASACIAYELSVRLYNPGNSEFAGMLSALVTLPSSLVMFALTPRVFGVRVGDSDAAFVTILGAAALLNAGILFSLLHRRTSKG
jgi:hypothetical protein